jgi:hypothetical protein
MSDARSPHQCIQSRLIELQRAPPADAAPNTAGNRFLAERFFHWVHCLIVERLILGRRSSSSGIHEFVIIHSGGDRGALTAPTFGASRFCGCGFRCAGVRGDFTAALTPFIMCANCCR